nr:hypothetical protein [Saprospiraceae bacterium]
MKHSNLYIKLFSIALLSTLLFFSCSKEDPIQVDPNLDKYKVEKLKVSTTEGDDLNAQTTISNAGANAFNI